jgi:hypothetical protein
MATFVEKNFDPYKVKHNLAMPEQSSLIKAWTFDFEFLKYFFVPIASKNRSVFFYI